MGLGFHYPKQAQQSHPKRTYEDLEKEKQVQIQRQNKIEQEQKKRKATTTIRISNATLIDINTVQNMKAFHNRSQALDYLVHTAIKILLKNGKLNKQSYRVLHDLIESRNK